MPDDMVEKHFTRRLVAALIMLLIVCWIGFCAIVQMARAAGKSIAEAVTAAYSFQSPWAWVTMGIGLLLVILILTSRGSRRSVPSREEQQHDFNRWKRDIYPAFKPFIPIVVISYALFTLIAFIMAITSAISGHLDRNAVMFVGLSAFGLAQYYRYWLVYNSVTDTYRVMRGNMDEREQEVSALATRTTLALLGFIGFLGGTLYETLFLGTFPFLTVCAIGTGFFIWTTSYWYWNRKL
jgi:hypothetical protein